MKHVEALHLRVKEYKEELALTKQEAKSLKKILKLSEVPSALLFGKLLKLTRQCCHLIMSRICAEVP